MPTDACNMNCKYCFHQPYYNTKSKMSIDTVEKLLSISAPFYEKLNIIWHGGEPLLMGMDFYKDVIRLEQSYQCKIDNSIQSNLTLLTPEWADFLISNNIYISGSFDGVDNDVLRGNSDKIINGRQMIVDRGQRCGLIMVVSGVNINNLIDSYRLFKKLNVNISLNLYLDQKDNGKRELLLDPIVTVEKLKNLFEYWAEDINGCISISYFKNILEYILHGKKSLCSFTSCLRRWIGIRHNGDIVPCNRFFPGCYNFGNVFNYNSIDEAFESEGFGLLLSQSILRREKCKSCRIYDFCNGGCNNTAMNENGIENNGGLSCFILTSMYEYIEEYIAKLDNSKQYNPILCRMINERK